jgi:hypothetical protein
LRLPRPRPLPPRPRPLPPRPLDGVGSLPPSWVAGMLAGTPVDAPVESLILEGG